MKIIIEEINVNNIDKAIDFILPYEYKCINLSDCLRRQQTEYKQKSNFFSFKKGFIIYETEPDKNGINIQAVIIINNSKTIFHCIPNPLPSIINSLTGIFKQCETKGIMGEAKSSLAIQEIFKTEFSCKPVKYTDYKLLIFQKENINNIERHLSGRAKNNSAVFESFPSETEFVRVSETDAEQLLPLQTAYEKEELLLPEKQIPRYISLIIFEKMLKKETVFAAKSHKAFIGKAGTNAQGFFWNQIGGVYVKPEYRNLGIGTELIRILLNNFAAEKKNAALFVKETNDSALKVYLKAGFNEDCGFKIIHF